MCLFAANVTSETNSCGGIFIGPLKEGLHFPLIKRWNESRLLTKTGLTKE